MGNDDKNKKTGVSPVVVGAAVAGAGIAAGAALALKDKQTRQQVGKAVSKIKNKANEYMEDIREGMSDSKEKLKTVGENIKNDVAEDIKQFPGNSKGVK